MTEASPPAAEKKETWKQALLNRRMLICCFIGFSSGLPLYLLINLVPAWLRNEGIDLKSIALFALVQFPYTWKFLWSPLFDRYALPLLGRRRGWLAAMQIALAAALFGLSFAQPSPEKLLPIFAAAILVAFFSASQDIVVDAYRRETLGDAELGLGSAL